MILLVVVVVVVVVDQWRGRGCEFGPEGGDLGGGGCSADGSGPEGGVPGSLSFII